MDERTPPTVGMVVCLVALAVLTGPFLVLAPSESSGLGTYYRSGIVGGWGIALLALVGVVAFASGRQERSEPETVAGATLVVGVAMTLLAVEWTLAVDAELVQSIGKVSWLSYHRWALVALSGVVATVAAWYARVLALL